MTVEVLIIADLVLTYVWSTVEGEQRSVCRGSVRQRGSGDRRLSVDVRYSARRFTQSLSIAKSIAEILYSSYRNVQIEDPAARGCVEDMLPGISYTTSNSQNGVEEDFDYMSRIITLIDEIKRSEISRTQRNYFRLLKNIVFDSMCAIVYLDTNSQESMSGVATLPEITSSCEVEGFTEEYLRNGEIIRQIITDFSDLKDKYSHLY